MTDIAKQWLRRIIGAFLEGFSHSLMVYLAASMATGIAPKLCPAMPWQAALIAALALGFQKLFKVTEKLGAVLQGKPEPTDDSNPQAFIKTEPPKTP